MLTREENDLLTLTGPGTPCGQLLRSYWQPAALSEELPPGGPPIPLRLFSENLVMFRDEQGRIGLLDLHCSHRGTDLSYGRIENGGLRCVYHGWLYDATGKCLETPAEPPGSHLREYVRHRSYPCQEIGGVIFTYMGLSEPPLLPNYEVFSAPPERRFMTKYFHECNYLQGLEGSQDGTHLRFLHRVLSPEPRSQVSDSSASAAPSGNRPSYRRPSEGSYAGPERVEENEFSVWSFRYGHGGPEYTFPSFCLTGSNEVGVGNGYQLFWRVPIDDTHHWQFRFTFSRYGPVKADNPPNEMTPDYHFIRNQENRYLQDREEQRSKTFTGIGTSNFLQDAMANETQGPIQDRTKEMLGAADMVIAAWRRMLLRAVRTVQDGGDPPGLIRDPRVNAVDPLFLKRNVPPDDADLEAILAETGGRWVTTLGQVGIPV